MLFAHAPASGEHCAQAVNCALMPAVGMSQLAARYKLPKGFLFDP